mmetsp:Transcript_9611/g.14648  ORF Transcript_9611/g.14648 Transcript_9611/m.14648 type:complete len:80 (-) Transcript_9611:849-1088(-)
MRFLIGACEEHPDKQKALFIMTYAVMMEELDRRLKRKDMDQVNAILKEVSKMLRTLRPLKAKGVAIYSVEDANTLFGIL